MKTPCEIVIWHILPAIRRELASNLVCELGLSQRHAARLLGMTDAAVSQYLSGKRAKLSINDEEVQAEIAAIAQRIVDGEPLTTKELCQVCTKLRKKPEIIERLGLFHCAYDDELEEGDEGR